jgi:uncharacterized protein YraI
MTARMKTALLAASFLGLLTGAAAADPATLVATSNLRAGPGAEYPIRVTIPGGATIDVQGCDGSWCVARYAEYEGYVPQSRVAGVGVSGPVIAVVPDEDYYYDEGPFYGYGYSPSYGYYYGGGHRRVHRDWQNSNRRSNELRQGNWQQTNRGKWQGNTGQPRGAAVQQRSQQNFGAIAPRVNSQPATVARGGSAGSPVSARGGNGGQGRTGSFGQ